MEPPPTHPRLSEGLGPDGLSICCLPYKNTHICFIGALSEVCAYYKKYLPIKGRFSIAIYTRNPKYSIHRNRAKNALLPGPLTLFQD